MNQKLICARGERTAPLHRTVEASMVAIKIIFTILGIWVVCSKTAPSNPALTKKLLAQPDDKDIEVPVQRRSEGKRSTEDRYDAASTSRQHRDTISRILNGVLLRNQLKTKNVNDKRSSQVAPGENSENASATQVSPNVHSDYLHIENYVPTFITIPCNSGSCDPSSYGNVNCQILSDIVQSNIPSTNTILCAQQASSNDLPSHDVIEDQSLIIPEAPALMPLSPPSTGYVLSNTNEKISESASSLSTNDNLSDTEFSKELQSEISNSPLLQSEHLDTPDLSSLPISYLHPEIYESYYDIVNDAINEDLHGSDYHRFAEFTSYPQLSLSANDEIIPPGIQTNLPLNSPSPFESTGLIPQPPTYFPLNPAHIEPEEQKKGEEIVSLLDPYEPSHILTIPEDTPSTFENQPIVVIPEAPGLMPLNPPNISYGYTPENTATFDQKLETTNYNYSEIASTTPQRGDIIESSDNINIETNLSENPAGPIESDILIPEPPIYFPLNPPKNNIGGQKRPGEIVSLLDNYESSYTITIPENTPSSVDSLPIIIPEAPELIPLNPPNIKFGSYSENKTYENKQTVHSDYLDPFPEIVTEFEELTESNYLLIPSAPGLLPLNPPKNLNSNGNKNSVGTELTNFSSTVQNYSANTIHTIDHAHSPTLDDSPNLLMSHYFNTQNKIASENFEPVTSSANYETTSLYETIEISKASELPPSNPSHSSLISSESSSSYDKNNNEITYYDQGKESLSADSIKIPEAPVLPPLSPPFTSSPYNSIVPSNLSFDSQVIKDENDFNNKEAAYSPSQPATSGSKTYNDDIFVNSKVFATKQPNPAVESELQSENTPLHILLTMNQQIIVPHILHNSNDLESNNHYEIQGQRANSVSGSSEYSGSVQEHSEPLSISQNSNIVVSSSPIAVQKTNDVVSQLDSTIQQLTTQDTEKKVQLNFRDLPPCNSEKPIDGIVINIFEPQKCKQEVHELKATSSSKQSTSKRSRRRKVVVRNRKGKRTNVTKNDRIESL